MTEMLPGAAIRIGVGDYTVPPLTLGQLRRLGPELDKIGSNASLADGEIIAAIVKIVGAALRRNYPDIGDEMVEEMLDLGNAAQVLNAVLAGSGLRRVATPGEDPAAGGTSSMASSPPPSATGPATSTN